MTDIVERLRLGGWAVPRATRNEAANEIERLREALKLARGDMLLMIGEIDRELRFVQTAERDHPS